MPSTLTVALPSDSAPTTSKASMPPVAPSHGFAVRVGPRVAVEYWGTRITWKSLCPWVADDAPTTYELMRPPPPPAPFIGTLPLATGPVATTYSWAPAVPLT